MYKLTYVIFALFFTAANMKQTTNLDTNTHVLHVEIPVNMMTRSVNDYLLIRKSLSFSAARSYCLERQMSLISLRTFEDQINYMIFLTLAGAMNHRLWTLGNRLREQWVWDIDGTPFTYSNWGKGEPNNKSGKQRCLATRGSIHNWDDEDCKAPLYFVCEKRLKACETNTDTCAKHCTTSFKYNS